MVPREGSESTDPASAGAAPGLVKALAALLRRPGVWLLGIAGTVVTGYVTAAFTDLAKPVSRYAAEFACEWRQPSQAPDESRFTILVSRLANDDADGSHTRRLFGTFRGERGFRPVLLCETLDFNDHKGLESSERETTSRGASLIKRRQADLLIFGSVVLANNSIEISAINEYGGCDERPKPVILQHGLLPAEFERDTKEKVIATTLKEITSACNAAADETVDWAMFEKRVVKMGPFIERTAPGLPAERVTEIAASYTDAMMLLYGHGRGDAWYDEAMAFVTAQIKALPPDASPYRRFLLLNSQADLLRERAAKTGSADDRRVARAAYERAIAEAERDRQPNRKYAEAYFNRAGYLDDADLAIKDYDQAIRHNPGDAIDFQSRGAAYLRKGDRASALLDYGEALALNPKAASAWRERAAIYAAQGQYDRAIQDLDVTLKLRPNDQDALLARADVHERRGDRARAADDFDTFVRVNPRRDDALVKRAVHFHERNEPARAMADLTEAINLNPQNAAALTGRGMIHLRKADYALAVKDFDQAARFDARSDAIPYWRGQAQAALGDHARAIHSYDEAIRRNPREYTTFIARGISHHRNGDVEGAVRDFDQAARLKPDDALVLMHRGHAYHALGDYRRAIDDYDQVVRLEPANTLALVKRGESHLASGSNDRAIADFDAAARLGANTTALLTGRASAYVRSGNHDGAIRDATAALTLDANDALALQLRASALRRKGDFKRALQDYDAALRFAPGFALALYGRGMVHHSSRQFDLAIADYDQVLQLQPAWAEVLFARGLARRDKGDRTGGNADMADATRMQATAKENFMRQGALSCRTPARGQPRCRSYAAATAER